MIPKTIEKKHILKAINELKNIRISNSRNSRKFILEYQGNNFSPKYIISIANKYANGKELLSNKFSGGKETNNFLKKLGFNIIEIQSTKHNLSKIIKTHNKHNERCTQCKIVIKSMLEKLFGKVELNHKFKIGSFPNDYKNNPYFDSIKKIYQSIQNYRSFNDFVKTKTLPNSDFYVNSDTNKFILEFDETQHFTALRKVALENYPKSLKIGFDRKRWISNCKKIDAKDNSPIYRDEQRAWYDTLRDFLPTTFGLKPTIRLYSKDYEWCSLNPDNPNDVKKFENILKIHYNNEIKINEVSTPFITRIIIKNHWSGEKDDAKQILEKVTEIWPKNKKTKILMTCGGFIKFKWPKDINRSMVGDNLKPQNNVINCLVKDAKKCIIDILNNDLRKKLSKITDYLTIGIDSFKDETLINQNHISQLHIELVFLIDIKNNKFYWTGKSYPTSGQQDGLIIITDLKSHFLNLKDIGNILLLGCHDLTIFNNRNMKNTGEWRKKIKLGFRKLAMNKKVNIILHHPHTTVKTSTWKNAWEKIKRFFPAINHFAGSGRYYEPNRQSSKYDDLNDVLNSTKHGEVMTLILPSNNS